jgi:hypothetical protein
MPGILYVFIISNNFAYRLPFFKHLLIMFMYYDKCLANWLFLQILLHFGLKPQSSPELLLSPNIPAVIASCCIFRYT